MKYLLHIIYLYNWINYINASIFFYIIDKSGKDVGAIFRDNRAVRNCITRLDDGKAIAIQLLDAPETVTDKHIVISIRR